MDGDIFMRLPNQEEFQKIYNALQDDASREIYRHRLLYSLLADRGELSEMIRVAVPDVVRLQAPKVCFYGGGQDLSGFFLRRLIWC